MRFMLLTVGSLLSRKCNVRESLQMIKMLDAVLIPKDIFDVFDIFDHPELVV